MRRRLKFTTAEDMALWRIAIEYQSKSKLGKMFKTRMKSKRTDQSLYRRFLDTLLPHLQDTKFHPETKLKLCKAYKVAVRDDFLNELQKDADIQLDEHNLVTSYQLNPDCIQNEDMELDDEDFIEITSHIVPKRRFFSEEEDAKVWKYVLRHHATFRRQSTAFWDSLSSELNRLSSGLKLRFINAIAPKIHLLRCSLEDHLKLYKSCEEPVNKKYLSTLKKHADLKLDRNGCITWYKLKNGRSDKRKSTERQSGRPKKARRHVNQEDDTLTEEESTESESDEEDLVVDNVVPGTGTPWPDVVPKVEANEDEQHFEEALDFQEEVVLDYENARQPNAEVFEPEYNLEQTDEQFIGNENGKEKKHVDENVSDPGTSWSGKLIVPKIEPMEDNEQRSDPLEFAEYVVPAHVCQPKAEVVDPEYYQEADLFADGEVVVQDHCASIEMVKEAMQGIEDKIEHQEETITTNISGVKEEIKVFIKAGAEHQAEEMKRDLEASLDAKLSEKLRNQEAAIEAKMIEIMAKGMEDMQNISKSQDPTASSRKKCLLNLKKLLTSMGYPETAIIEQKIDKVIESLPENDERPFPKEIVSSVLEIANRFINRLS